MSVVKAKKRSQNTTIILILLIAIAVMGILTGKRLLETARIDPVEDNIKNLTEIVNDNPENLDARLALAYTYQKQKQWDQAREIYEDVLRVDSANQTAMYHLGVIDFDNKQYDDAEKKFKALVEKYPDHLLGLQALGEIYLEKKKPDLAIQHIDKAIQFRPDIIDFHFVKAAAYEQKGDKAKAKAEYQAVLKYVPENKRATDALAKLK